MKTRKSRKIKRKYELIWIDKNSNYKKKVEAKKKKNK